jgi:hypothetical protein
MTFLENTAAANCSLLCLNVVKATGLQQLAPHINRNQWIVRPHLPPIREGLVPLTTPPAGPPLGPLPRTQLPVRHIAHHSP